MAKAGDGTTDWMYQGPHSEMNKEEYLLGKQIGKNFEKEGTMGQMNAVEYGKKSTYIHSLIGL